MYENAIDKDMIIQRWKEMNQTFNELLNLNEGDNDEAKDGQKEELLEKKTESQESRENKEGTKSETRKWSSGKKYPAPDPTHRLRSPEPQTWSTYRILLTLGFGTGILLTGTLLLFLFLWLNRIKTEPCIKTKNVTDKINYKDKGVVVFEEVKGRHLLLIGGQDEGQNRKSLKVLQLSGFCNFPDNYPSRLPQGRSGHTAVLVKQQIVIVCGGHSESMASSTDCWKYSPDNWWSLPGLQSPTSYAASSALDSDVYVLGGINYGIKIDDVQIFNIKNETWRIGHKMPDKIWGHCAANLNDKIVSTGGWSQFNVDLNMRSTFEYDPKTNSWTEQSPMKYERSTHGCASLSLKGSMVLIVAGGINVLNEPIRSVEIYRNDVWTSLSDTLKSRNWYPVINVLDNRLVIYGGDTVSNSMEILNPVTKKWKIIFLPITKKRFNGKGVLVPSSWFPYC